MKPNILLCGRTGAGKTSLIQSVTEKGTVPESAVSDSASATRGFHVYETEAANFIDSEGMEPGVGVSEYASFINGELCRRFFSGRPEQLIHCIWYCLDSAGARVQSADRDLFRSLPEHSLLVMTKSELLRASQLASLNESVGALLPPEEVFYVSAAEGSGLEHLIARTFEFAAEKAEESGDELASFRMRWNLYYETRMREWRERNCSLAEAFVKKTVKRAFWIALFPLPLLDVLPLFLNEVHMLAGIAAIYGYPVLERHGPAFLLALSGSAGEKLLATFFLFFKAPLAALTAYGVGHAAISYYESGMTLSPEDLRLAFEKAEMEARSLRRK